MSLGDRNITPQDLIADVLELNVRRDLAKAGLSYEAMVDVKPAQKGR